MKTVLSVLLIYMAIIVAAILLNKPSYCKWCINYKAVRKIEIEESVYDN
jgi:hypothetical protein